MAMKSSEYWKKREAENAMKNQISEVQYKKDIEEIYANMMDEINKEINGFYTKYAAKEGITMAEAKKRVSKLDIAAYERKAKKYVETKDFSDRANEEMRIYNLTMKVNRLELLKANIGLEMVSGFDDLQKYFDKKLTKRTLDEFRRQAGILGKSIMKNEKYAHAIVNASFKNATYSDRIWMYQGMLKAELEGLLASGLIRGQNPKKLAKHLEKRFGVSAYNAQRLMTTELARVQTEAQKQSFIRNGFDEYEYIACGNNDVCSVCKALDGKHFKVDDMMPGSRELTARSSGIPRELPISRRFMEPRTSFTPPKERLPFMRTRVRASVVSVWLCRIVPSSQDGCSSRHICFPISVEAYSVSWSMIFVYSRVFNAFSFMLW